MKNPAYARGMAALVALVALAAGACEGKPPESPEGPRPGNCCMRNAEPAERVCGEKLECCRELEQDECEAKQGIWFHSLEGCRGAC